MKKYTIISLSSIILIGMSVFSCSKSLDNSEETLPQKKVNANIPANFASSKVVADGGAATFSTSEKVYVYNNATSTLDADYLSPDADGATANLKGSLSGTYSAGNSLKLLYNTTSEGIADYTNQDGTLENVIDAATATVKISSVDGDSFTTRTAYFENLQSIFKFTFKDPDNNIVKVKSLTILSENNKLQSEYNLLDEAVTYGGINVICNTAQSTVYVALRFTSNPSEMILFSVIDENGKVYTGSKTSPATGFKIGRFYTSTVSVKAHTFSVAKDKKVYFALGNLYDDGGVYKIQSSPWVVSDVGSGDFFDRNLITSTMASSEISITVNGIDGWYAPVSAYWIYLNDGSRTFIDDTRFIRPYKIETDEKTNNIFGLMFLPDDFTYSEDIAELEAEEKYRTFSRYKKNVNIFKYLAKGCVFIPGYERTGGFAPCYASGNHNQLCFSQGTSSEPTPRSSFSGGSQSPVPVRLIHE